MSRPQGTSQLQGVSHPQLMRSASLTLPGQASQVRVVRRWLTGLVAGLPGAADVVLAASELAANAVSHSDSGQPGGTFTIRVAVGSDLVRVEVADAGGAWRVRSDCDGPGPGDADWQDRGWGSQLRGDGYGDDSEDGQCGRGLAIVASLASAWGIDGCDAGRTAWCELPS